MDRCNGKRNGNGKGNGKRFRYWFGWLALIGSSGLFASVESAEQCGCVCVDGMAKTLCTSVSAARTGRALCMAQPSCPQPAASPSEPATEYLPEPVSGVTDCRRATFWDRGLQVYRPGKICDVEPTAD